MSCCIETEKAPIGFADSTEESDSGWPSSDVGEIGENEVGGLFPWECSENGDSYDDGRVDSHEKREASEMRESFLRAFDRNNQQID